MAIFNSYVSLPEGNPENIGTSAILQLSKKLQVNHLLVGYFSTIWGSN